MTGSALKKEILDWAIHSVALIIGFIAVNGELKPFIIIETYVNIR